MSKQDRPIAISACLAGCRTRYDGGSNDDHRLRRLVAEGKAFVVCPELAAGLPIPRPAAEIVEGDGADVLSGRARVLNKQGEDWTDRFLLGAQVTLKSVCRADAEVAILKERSPSCGVNKIYDGTFCGSKRPGLGVTAALLREHGITLYTEEDCEEFLRSLTDQ